MWHLLPHLDNGIVGMWCERPEPSHPFSTTQPIEAPQETGNKSEQNPFVAHRQSNIRYDDMNIHSIPRTQLLAVLTLLIYYLKLDDHGLLQNARLSHLCQISCLTQRQREQTPTGISIELNWCCCRLILNCDLHTDSHRMFLVVAGTLQILNYSRQL